MNTNPSNIKSKATGTDASRASLARLMASENLTVQHSGAATTAKFDTTKRVLILPVWKDVSDDVYTSFVAHEVGHALFTPAAQATVDAAIARLDKSKPKMAFYHLNAIEDARIERLLKEKYRGLSGIMKDAYAELVNTRDIFRTKGIDLAEMRFIDRLNIHFKAGHVLSVPFKSDEERDIVEMAARAQTFEDVVAAAERAWKLTEQEEQQDDDDQDQESEDGDGEAGDEESDSDSDGSGDGDGQDSDSDSDSDGKSDKEGKGKGEGKDSDKDSKDSGKGEGKGKGQGDKPSSKNPSKSSSGDQPSKPGSKGAAPSKSSGSKTGKPGLGHSMDAADSALSGMIDTNAPNYVYLTMPELKDTTPAIVPVSRILMANKGGINTANSQNLKKQLLAQLSPTVNLLAREFDMRKAADTYRRTRQSDSGRIDTNKLAMYQVSDDIFRKNAVVPVGKNHGMVMVLDWSGSMSGITAATLRQVATMILFCKRVSIPYEVFLFSDNYSAGRSQLKLDYRPTDQRLSCPEACRLLNIASSRSKLKESNESMELIASLIAAYEGSSSGSASWIDSSMGQSDTPLNDTLMLLENVITRFQKATRVQFTNVLVLTDGESSHMHAYSDSAVEEVRNNRSNGKPIVYVLQDPVTKEELKTDRIVTTNYLVNVLRKRTKSNVVLFDLVDSASAPYRLDAWNRNPAVPFKDPNAAATVAKIQKDMKESNFGLLPTNCFTEAYMIQPGSLKLTTAKTAAESISMKSRKEKLFLARFIDLISRGAPSPVRTMI